MTTGRRRSQAVRGLFTRLFTVFLVSMLSIAGVSAAAAPAAQADAPGINTTVLHNGNALSDGAVVEPGDALTFTSEYTAEVGDGAEVVIGLPGGVTLDESTLDSAGKEALESVTQDDRGVVYSFGDPLPEEFERESHSFQVTIDEVEATEVRAITWSVNGVEQSRQVTVEVPGEEQEEASENPAEETPETEEPTASEAPAEESVDVEEGDASSEGATEDAAGEEPENASETPSEGDESSAPAPFNSIMQTAGVSANALHNDDPLAEDAVVESGDTLTLRVQYNNAVDTSSPVVVSLPDGMTFDESSLDVPSSNTAIENISLDDGDVHITFYDTDDWGETNQGVWDLNLTFDTVEHTEQQTIEWSVGPETFSRTVIVTDGDAQEENVSDHLAKSVDTEDLNQFVNVDQLGVVSLDEDEILEHEFTYTLEMRTDRNTDRSDITISDELSEYLMYNEDSFEAEITTWDDIGWNPTTSDFEFNPDFTDNGFDFTGGVENPSELTVTYSAQVDPNQLESLTDALQAEFDALDEPGAYSVGLDNTVSFGEYGERASNVTIGGNRGEDDYPTTIENDLNKSAANAELDQYVGFDESGTVVLDEEVTTRDIEYTLTVNSASGRTEFTIADQLSEYLAYNEGSFEANITTSEDGGWTWDTNPFEFEPDVDGNSFTFTGNIEEQSELTITYTASVAEGQHDALRDAIQREFDDLGVEPGDYRVQLDNTATFGGDQERKANVSIGNNRGDGEGPENVSNQFDKQVGETALSAFVSIYEGVVSVDEDILDAVIDYTLTVNTDADTDRSDFTITDELSEYLTYDQDDFDAEITTWGSDGWNQETNPFEIEPEFSDNGFTYEGDIENPSELTITYSAFITEAQREALEEALQGEFDALGVGYGDFGLNLENTATFGEETRTDDVPISGSLEEPPVPQPSEAFDKGADFSDVNIATAEDGTLEPPQEITYTFNADLSQWDGNAEDGYLNDEDFTLGRNVVISDTLPEQAEWDTSAEDFISGMELTQAEDFDGDSAAFAANDYVNQYAVVGQNLYLNIGQDSATNAEISATALITTTDGLSSSNDGGIERYELTNDAQFTFNDDGDPYGSSVEVTLNDRGDGLEDEAKFSKTALDGDDPVYVEEGESATLEYRFQANGDGSDAVDVTQSYIVDHRDPNVFDFSDLDQTVESISGTLHGDAVSFDESHFDLSANDDGELVIALNESGIAAVEESGAEPTAPYVVDIALNTVPLSDQQTLNVENSATLYGSDDYPLYWSETTSEASSYGDEAETRKSIRDSSHEEWTQNLRVEIDEDDELVQDEYVYNLAFVPHGNYSSVTINPVSDELPEEVEFVGFVDHDDVDAGDNPTDGPKDIGGNLEAVYDEDEHTVTVQQQEGTLLDQEENISANVLVRIVEFEEDVPVANFFGSSSAEYTPSDGYPISIAKVNSQNDEVVINDPESRFQVLDSEDNVVVEEAFVEDGQLRVLDEDGEASGLVVREPGTYYVEETVAPEGYELSTDRIAVVVDTYGNSEQQTFENDPIPNVEIIKGDGDAEAGTITNDANSAEAPEQYGHLETRDVVITVQNAGNEDLTDVVLTDETQSGADIESLVWSLPNGETVEASANEDGVLTANWDGPWAVGETITGTATLTLTAGDELHTNLASVDAVGAASGTPVEDEDPYNADPADRDYAIGDYVWFDSDNDGLQGEDEEPLEDVTVVLYDQDGEELDRAGTDERGRYFFDNLPAGDYSVQFILTDEQAATYKFTDALAGDVEADSDAGAEGRSEEITLGPDNEFLTADEEYEYFDVEASEGIDPTWDAGVVLLDPAVEIIKGDGDAEAGAVDNDANTEDEAVAYENGETRDVVINVTNTGEEDLVDVVLTDETLSGTAVEGLVWTTPDGTEIAAEDVDGVLNAAWDGPWAVGETITGVATLTLAEGEELHTNLASVTALGAGTGTPVEDEDPYNGTPPEPEPEDPTYAIGDYVWIDSDGNGIQGEDEDRLEDVTVVLYDGEGEEVSRTATDEDGRYIFDELPAGDYQVQFILTEEQTDLYEFTSYTSGDDVTGDSNAGEEGRSATITLGPDNEFLTSDEDYDINTVSASEGIDPTWDAGVVLMPEETPEPSPTPTEPEETPEPSPTPTGPTEPEDPTYAVGDYVWIDSDNDGIQDEDEDPLEGVTVILRDGDGNEIDRSTTDEDGRYIFDELPAGDYQIQFELTNEQTELYGFTGQHSSEDAAQDSDANPATGLTPVFSLGEDSPGLTQDYEREYLATGGLDPTWDAGVVLIEEAEVPPPAPSEPTEDPTEESTPTPTDPTEGPEEPEPSETPTESAASPAPAGAETEDEDDDGSLARTGSALGGVLLASLAILFGGLLLKQWNDRRRNAEI